MKRTACLLALAASAGGFALAQTAPRPAPVLVEVIGAEMSSRCRESDVARARKVSEACDGKQQCAFMPEATDDAGEACARESLLLWRCGATGEARSMPLAQLFLLLRPFS